MPKYADVYLLPIAEDKVEEYKKTRKAGGKGLYQTRSVEIPRVRDVRLEGRGSDSLSKVIELKPGETVIYAAVEFKSEAHRNSTMKKIMADPDMDPGDKPMPFDFRRMVYGGFKVLVDL